MKLAVDIDGVVCDLASAICKRISEKYDIDLKVSDITEWNLRTNKFDFYSEIEEAQQSPAFMIALKPIKGAQKAIKKLLFRYEIIFVTARPVTCSLSTRAWVMRYFGNIPIYHLPGEGGHGVKETIDFDILIDDSPVNVLRALDVGRKVIIYTQPWNKLFEDPRVIRVNDWDEVLEVL